MLLIKLSFIIAHYLWAIFICRIFYTKYIEYHYGDQATKTKEFKFRRNWVSLTGYIGVIVLMSYDLRKRVKDILRK